MIKRKKILLFLLILNLLSLTACIPDVKFDFKEDHPSSSSSVRKGETSESETSKRNSSSDHSSEQESHSETIPSSSQVTKPLEKLPLHASEAPQDKIYATRGSIVFYYKEGDTISAQIPYFEGYTKKIVQKILGKPDQKQKSIKYLQETFKERELENVKALYQDGKITEEEAKAFFMSAVDLSQALNFGSTYTIFTYKKGKIQLVFEEDQLIYVTPDPDVLYFKL